MYLSIKSLSNNKKLKYYFINRMYLFLLLLPNCVVSLLSTSISHQLIFHAD